MRAASAWRCALCVALSLLAPAAPAPPPVPLKGLPATSWGQQSPGSAPRAQAASPAAHDGQAVGYAESARLRAEAADAFAHAYGGYLNTAYPRDETKVRGRRQVLVRRAYSDQSDNDDALKAS